MEAATAAAAEAEAEAEARELCELLQEGGALLEHGGAAARRAAAAHLTRTMPMTYASHMKRLSVAGLAAGAAAHAAGAARAHEQRRTRRLKQAARGRPEDGASCAGRATRASWRHHRRQGQAGSRRRLRERPRPLKRSRQLLPG